MIDKMLTWEEAVQWLKDQPEKSELVKFSYYLLDEYIQAIKQ